MKIFLDNCLNHIALQRMLPEWSKMGVKWSQFQEGCDVQLSFVKISHKTSLPVVLRLDGIYYDSDTDYKKRNERISEAHSSAKAVIYQSRFCKRMCERYLVQREGSSHIVYNGVEKNWCGKHINSAGIDVVAVAKWRRHKRLEETVNVFLKYHQHQKNSRLHIIGDLVKNVKMPHPAILYYGELDYEQIKKPFALADVALHLSMKDCCPNFVVEAIGAGLPVVTTSACGGAAEMCGMADISIAAEPEKTDPCPHYRDSYNEMPKATGNILVGKLIEMEDKRVAQPVELSVEHMAKRYAEIMEGWYDKSVGQLKNY